MGFEDVIPRRAYSRDSLAVKEGGMNVAEGGEEEGVELGEVLSSGIEELDAMLEWRLRSVAEDWRGRYGETEGRR